MIRRILSILRKVVLVGLTLAAVGMGLLWLISYATQTTWTVRRSALAFDEATLSNGYYWYTRYVVDLRPVGSRDASMRGPSHTTLEPTWSMAQEQGAPLGSVSLLLGAYPTIAFIQGPVRRWWRRRRGLCVQCGYDLTGNVSGICSECGTESNKP